MKRRTIYNTLTAATLLLGLMSLRAQPDSLKPPEGVSKSELKEAYLQARSLQIIYQTVYENVRPSVVQVIVEGKASEKKDLHPFMDDPFFRKFFGEPPSGQTAPSQNVPTSLGSGFIIDEDGTIITNKHVVENAKTVKVKLHDGRTIEGTVRGYDDMTDIAVINLNLKSNLRPAILGDSDKVRVGDIAIAMGNPFGLDGTFTTGVISAVGRAGLDNSGLKFIQTDAAVNQGNSGGPLLNMDGEVIGINRMIVSPSGGSVGIGFSIPINEVRNIIKQIRVSGTVERPLLGVGIEILPEELNQNGKIKGLFVSRVQSGTGAWNAGIKPNDIILDVDGKNMTEPEILVKYVLTKKVGDRLIVQILRNDKKISLSVLLGKR